MFLNSISNEDKKFFLELAYIAANCDNKLCDSELQLLSLYRGEMNFHNYEIQKIDLKNIINYFKEKDQKTKKIIFFETLGVIWIDGKIRPEEATLITTLQENFQGSDSTTSIAG